MNASNIVITWSTRIGNCSDRDHSRYESRVRWRVSPSDRTRRKKIDHRDERNAGEGYLQFQCHLRPRPSLSLSYPRLIFRPRSSVYPFIRLSVRPCVRRTTSDSRVTVTVASRRVTSAIGVVTVECPTKDENSRALEPKLERERWRTACQEAWFFRAVATIGKFVDRTNAVRTVPTLHLRVLRDDILSQRKRQYRLTEVLPRWKLDTDRICVCCFLS